VALDQQLLEILACPDTHHAPLGYDADAQTLTCTECGRIFPIRDDIPILLLDEAQLPAADEPVIEEPEAEEPAPAVEKRTSAGPLADTSVEKPAGESEN
jgi:uncharacterized protein YbaR (Trm112 family)